MDDYCLLRLCKALFETGLLYFTLFRVICKAPGVPTMTPFVPEKVTGIFSAVLTLYGQNWYKCQWGVQLESGKLVTRLSLLLKTLSILCRLPRFHHCLGPRLISC